MAKSVRAEATPRDPNEPVERMIRRFTKKVKKERIIELYLEGTQYEKPSERRRKEKAQRKKTLKKLRIERERAHENKR